MDTGICYSCRANIIWATTPAGRRIPLDPEPLASGVFQLNADGSCEVLTAEARAEGEPVPLYRSHFASCTFADAHRKRKAKTS